MLWSNVLPPPVLCPGHMVGCRAQVAPDLVAGFQASLLPELQLLAPHREGELRPLQQCVQRGVHLPAAAGALLLSPAVLVV